MYEELDINSLVDNEPRENFEKDYQLYKKHLQHQNKIIKDYYSKYSLNLIRAQYFQSPYKFKPTSTMMPRRQLEYLNSIQPNNPVSTAMINAWIAQQDQPKYSLVKRKRNTMAFLNEGELIQCYGSVMRRIHFKFQGVDNENIGLQFNTVKDTKGTGELMQLANYGDQQLLLSRQLYRLEVLQFQHLKYKYLSDHEITSCTVNPFKSSQVAFTTFHNGKSIVQVLKPGDDISFSFSHEDQLMALQYINRSSIIISTQNKISTLDLRTKGLIEFYTVSNKAERRILDLVWLRTPFKETPYFVVGNSTFVEVFDIRNSKSSVSQTKHRCEESPPINYVAFQHNYRPNNIQTLLATKRQQTKNMLIVGHSPNYQGASVFLEFSPETNLLEVDNQRYMAGLCSGKRTLAHKTPMRMLFNYSIFPTGQASDSVNPYLNQGKLYMFHGGSQGSLTIECFQNDDQLRPIVINDGVGYDNTQAQLKRLQREAFVQKSSVKEEGEEEFQFKKNYAMYRNIADSDLEAFSKTLFRKAKTEEVQFEYPVKPAQRSLVQKSQKGDANTTVTEDFIGTLIQEW